MRAQVVWVEGEKVPLMVQKTDGGFGYGTTDMAALRQRVHDERGEWLIYVVDEGQAGHFKRALSPCTLARQLPVASMTHLQASLWSTYCDASEIHWLTIHAQQGNAVTSNRSLADSSCANPY